MLQWQGRAVDVRAVGRFVVRGSRRAALTLIGLVLVVVGLAGLVLPVLPGWVLIIAGFAVLSREYSWAHSGLAFARRHAARSSQKLRSLATRRRTPAASLDPVDSSAEVLIDLTNLPDESEEAEAGGHPRLRRI
jgi:putative transmembrane protein PGPGW